ncbi:MAG: saccharopine dehydrogenase family protein, partial [Rhodospirillales bacterium]|nr:saccharopine dehydrogenase family protein [Rhodospirillales bacterium]
RFDEPHDVRLRVGALPQYPANALKYNLTWSIDGLINEYCNPCEAIVEGRFMEVLPLEGLEEFSLDGVHYEAFSTSGGIGTLCETLMGTVRNLNYKTVRYPGHRDAIHLLANDLRLCSRRDIFRDVIEHAVPITRQDVVLIFITVTGLRRGLLTQESYAKKIYGDQAEDGCSAIQKTTAAGLCAMVDLHRAGKLPATGFVRQEDVDLADILANRFGKIYA